MTLVYGVKLGGVIWVWRESSKRMVEGEGLVKTHDFYFAHFLNIWQYNGLQTFYVDENHHFFRYSAKSPCENSMFLRFFSEKMIFGNFQV